MRARVHTGGSIDVSFVEVGGTVAVAEQAPTGLRRLRMSWADYLALPEKPRAEWVDGEVVVSPPIWPDHGIATVDLGVALKLALPRLFVMTEVGVKLPRNRVRAPDLMVLAERPRERFVDGPVVLVVEVLSPSTRSEDLLRKGPEYAAAGVGQYWIVDPEGRSLEVSDNIDGEWILRLRLDDEHPAGEVTVSDHGTVPLDLRTILGPLPD